MFAQRWKRYRDNIKPEIQVLSKFAGFDRLLEVLVGCGKNACLELNRLSFRLPLSNSLCCRTRNNFACMDGASSPISSRNSVPAPAASSLPFFTPTRAGECALFMSK